MSNNADVPIACDLNALTTAERERRRDLARAFALTIIARRELSNGFEFELDGARVDPRALAEWIALEHRCCPFLHFRLELEPAGGRELLALTGRDGVKEFLRAEMT
jgi:hypothetical protein